MPNATISKFGYPQSLVAEFNHWVVLVRPSQVTLGSLVLAAKSEATAYGDLPPEAFAEQGPVIARVEQALRQFTNYEKLNYLMLMMVDPNVHFHVIPRYSGFRERQGLTLNDAGWPGPPDLKSATNLEPGMLEAMVTSLRPFFR